MRSFLELLKKNGSILLIGLLIGLVGGFRIANSRYREAQRAVVNAQAARAAARLGDLSSQAPGRHALSQDQVNAAIARARANPNDYDAQLNAADQFLEIQRPEGAVEFLQQAIKLKPADPRALTALSTAKLFLGQFEEAATWARKALNLQPADVGAKLLLVLALIEARQHLDEADQLLSQLEQTRPGDRILADTRASLQAARAGGGQSPAKTNLEHGPAPEQPPGVKPRSGGAR